MVIKVIGKSHMEGTSKRTGNQYNFNTVYFNAKARGVDGLAAKSTNIDGSFIRYEDIQVGGSYNLEFDERGYVMAFEPAKI